MNVAQSLRFKSRNYKHELKFEHANVPEDKRKRLIQTEGRKVIISVGGQILVVTDTVSGISDSATVTVGSGP